MKTRFRAWKFQPKGKAVRSIRSRTHCSKFYARGRRPRLASLCFPHRRTGNRRRRGPAENRPITSSKCAKAWPTAPG
jgi:hypothetical protein